MYNNLDNLFNISVEKINNNNFSLDNDLLLNLYGLYKQAKFGSNKTSQPKILSLRQRVKWVAWKDQGNKSEQDAKLEYIDLVNKNLA